MQLTDETIQELVKGNALQATLSCDNSPSGQLAKGECWSHQDTDGPGGFLFRTKYNAVIEKESWNQQTKCQLRTADKEEGRNVKVTGQEGYSGLYYLQILQ